MTNSSIFNYRVAAIIRDEKSRILLQHSHHGYWYLPGGRCEMNEFSKDALMREFKEKIGTDIEIKKPIFLAENIFNFEGTKVHEVGIYYLADFTDSSLYAQDEIKGIEPGKDIVLQWFAPDEIEKMDFRPEALKQSLKNIPEYMEIVEIVETRQ